MSINLRRIRTWLSCTAFLQILVSPSAAQDYTWPLRRFAGCTSLFGDYRPGRYHAGLDLKTDGEDGWPVVAVADGHIMRASTSYYGYGRALYLKLDDGKVAVYGHLSEFGPQVTARVEAEQRRARRYRTNVYFAEGELRVTKGMTIARSGQTGAGAPHLHFEIRTPDNRPLNPAWQGFRVPDRRDPEITTLWLLPQYVGGKLGSGPDGPDPARVPMAGGPHAPLSLASGTLYVSGPVGFAVEAYDRKPNSEARHNVSGLLLAVGGDTLFQARFDTLDYETMGQVRLERLLWLDPEGDTYALFKRRGNVLAHSRAHPNHAGGVCVVQPGDTALPFEIVVFDESGNRRTLRGHLAYGEPVPAQEEPLPDPVVIRAGSLDLRPDRARGLAADLEARGLSGRLVPLARRPARVVRLHASDLNDSVVWHEATEPMLSRTTVLALAPGRAQEVWLPDSSLEIKVAGDAVYEPSFLVVRSDTLANGAAVVHLEPADLVLCSPLRLSFRPPPEEREALFTTNGRVLAFVEKRRTAGRIECTAGGAASFTFAADSLPPVVRRLRPSEGAVVGRRPVVTAHVDDDLSGVGDDSLISVRLDGEWLLPEYDPETHRLSARPFVPLKPGSHRLDLEVQDWAGNVTRMSRTFRVK